MKRILSLDGGGVRGILTLGMLKKIESLLLTRGLKITDYFDLIGGTSTGAIIACGLAIGKSVDELIELYLQLGTKIFGRKIPWYLKDSWDLPRVFLKENYSSKNLESYLKQNFGDLTIGDELQCGLAINCKRADTYSLWTVVNNPNCIYYEANKHLKLWELCRASSAAPSYFKPKLLKLKTRKGVEFDASFIDGGVSLANNPAWELFLVATIESFGYNWETGVDNINIVSLGTGNGILKEDASEITKNRTYKWASKIPDLFMVDALETNMAILSTVGKNLAYPLCEEEIEMQKPLNSQYGFYDDFKSLKESDKMFSFTRHNVSLSKNYLLKMGFDLGEIQEKEISALDSFQHMVNLLEIGELYAENSINPNQLK